MERGSLPTPGTITTVAGMGLLGYDGDGGPAIAARLNRPYTVTVAPDGCLYIADFDNHCVRKVDLDGLISTVAGVGSSGGSTAGDSGDGGPATAARLNYPLGLAVGPDGCLYIADTENDRVRRIEPDGTIRTVAGTGRRGFGGDGKPATASHLNCPAAVTTGPDGSLYIAERNNCCVRQIRPDGTIVTVAGLGSGGLSAAGYSGDGGPAVRAALCGPTDVALGPDGSLYIADSGNSRVRRVAPDGIISTIAGNGMRGDGGDGGPATAAQLNLRAVTVARTGAVYIADYLNHRVRAVTPDGQIFTIAGTGLPGFSGDGGPAIDAQLSQVGGVALGPHGDLYLGDAGNVRVRKVWRVAEEHGHGGKKDQSHEPPLQMVSSVNALYCPSCR